MKVEIRDSVETDFPVFFEHHQDPDALYMAAFTPPDPTDRSALYAHWGRILRDQSILMRTILVDGQIAGSLVYFEMFDQQQVGYWIGHDFWGKGVATRALSLFLDQIPQRPVYARVAFDNIGSRRVLEKCGFVQIGVDRGYAYGRGQEIEELILQLK